MRLSKPGISHTDRKPQAKPHHCSKGPDGREHQGGAARPNNHYSNSHLHTATAARLSTTIRSHFKRYVEGGTTAVVQQLEIAIMTSNQLDVVRQNCKRCKVYAPSDKREAGHSYCSSHRDCTGTSGWTPELCATCQEFKNNFLYFSGGEQHTAIHLL